MRVFPIPRQPEGSSRGPRALPEQQSALARHAGLSPHLRALVRKAAKAAVAPKGGGRDCGEAAPSHPEARPSNSGATYTTSMTEVR